MSNDGRSDFSPIRRARGVGHQRGSSTYSMGLTAHNDEAHDPGDLCRHPRINIYKATTGTDENAVPHAVESDTARIRRSTMDTDGAPEGSVSRRARGVVQHIPGDLYHYEARKATVNEACRNRTPHVPGSDTTHTTQRVTRVRHDERDWRGRLGRNGRSFVGGLAARHGRVNRSRARQPRLARRGHGGVPDIIRGLSIRQ